MKKLKIVSEELFHKSPRNGPPRYDLRKRKKIEDPDLIEEDIENKDEDLEKKT